MELQELVERIERWKSRQQGSAPAARPPSLPTAMAAGAFEEDSAGEEMAEENGSMEEIEAVEEFSDVGSSDAALRAEETSEVGLDQIEDVDAVEEVVEDEEP